MNLEGHPLYQVTTLKQAPDTKTSLSQKQISVLALPQIFQHFNCCLSVTLPLDNGDYPENLPVTFHPNKQHLQMLVQISFLLLLLLFWSKEIFYLPLVAPTVMIVPQVHLMQS